MPTDPSQRPPLRHRPRTARRADRERILRWPTAVVAAATAAAFGSALATAGTPSPPPQAAETPIAPPAVENFGYPGASGISKVKLLRGDGSVMLTDCAAKPSQIQLWTRAPGNTDNKLCLTATSPTGFLTLQLPDVFAVQTSDRSLRVDLTAADTSQSLDVPKNGFKGLGEGLSQATTTMVQLRVTG
ncbi:hypothetical protein [Kitasatospora sp. NPDC094016]|uniref:hypothetical protein n=1 Tax=Kitasatospora sp. NPDC094016 TaxID=3154986 RepID=UPI00331E3403